MFSKKLIKVYLARFIGLIGSILSMTIVLPFISSDTESYGIYSIVLSLMILLQFADLGFLGAGQKYAAEYYAMDNIKLEIETLSFVHFVLFVSVIIYTLFLCLVYNYPSIIFSDLSSESLKIAKKLIFIFLFNNV